MNRIPVAMVIEDEPAVRDIIEFALQTQGFEVHGFGRAEPALSEFSASVPSLAVIDITLPGMSGISLCRRMRAISSVPIILVTARSETHDRIDGLEAGADDYLTKPFHPRELALRAHGLLRRSSSSEPRSLQRGTIDVDLRSSIVRVGGVEVRLSRTEYAILVELMSADGAVVSPDRLCRAAWGEHRGVGEAQLLKTTIYRLRGKLAAADHREDLIRNARGEGYSMSG